MEFSERPSSTYHRGHYFRDTGGSDPVAHPGVDIVQCLKLLIKAKPV